MSTKLFACRSRPFLMAMTAMLVASLAGCASGGAGSAMAYLRGDLDATLDASFEKAVRATELAVEQLRFEKLSEKKDALQAIIVSRNATDKRVEIRLEKVAETATNLKIRVGAFGDESLAVATYSQITANL